VYVFVSLLVLWPGLLNVVIVVVKTFTGFLITALLFIGIVAYLPNAITVEPQKHPFLSNTPTMEQRGYATHF
jgi:hypothetical protein